jgi:hypothetical protein
MISGQANAPKEEAMRRIPYLLAAAGLVLAGASPALADAKTFLGFLREKLPQSKSEIKRAFADGDVVQPVPEKAANNNTMF